jgi:hypothetical protein
MTHQSEIDRSFQEFVGHARNGNFGGYMPLEDLVNQPSYNGQTLRNPGKRLRTLARKIIRSTGLAYPHRLKADRLERDRTRDRAANTSLANMNTDLRAIRIFQSLSPVIALAATGLLVQSFPIALLVTAIGLLLAAILAASDTTVKWQSNFWNWVAVVYTIAATVFGVSSAGVSESLVWLLGLCTLVSLLTVCFSGKSGLEAISLLWFLVRDWWRGVRIAWENLAFWLPRRVYRVETALQEYINLANESGLPVGPFSFATRDVLTQWFGYNPFPDGNIPVVPPNGNLPQQPAPESYEQEDDRADAEANAVADYDRDLQNQRMNEKMRDDEGQVS